MPVYFITVHTYRSWREDNPQGYIQRGKAGIQRPNPKLYEHRQKSATDKPVELTDSQITLVLDALRGVSLNLEVEPYAASCTSTHWHLLVGWVENEDAGSEGDSEDRVRSITTRLKRVIGSKLSADAGQPGHRWFSRGWHIERIDGQKHFDHLVQSYLPKHASEGGRYVAWPKA